LTIFVVFEYLVIIEICEANCAIVTAF
jgi:hypothetical protein